MNRVIWILLLIVSLVVFVATAMQYWVVKKSPEQNGTDKARKAKEAKRKLRLEAEALGLDFIDIEGLSLEESKAKFEEALLRQQKPIEELKQNNDGEEEITKIEEN